MRARDCLFKAIVVALDLKATAHKELREWVCIKFCEESKLGVENHISKLVELSLEDYVKKMSKAKEYGGSPEIAIIAKFLEVRTFMVRGNMTKNSLIDVVFTMKE